MADAPDQPSAPNLARGSDVSSEAAREAGNGAVEAVAPLCWAQQFFWFDHHFLGTRHRRLLNLSRTIRGDGPCDRSAVKLAVDAVVARHASLRTRFRVADDGRPSQTVLAASPGMVAPVYADVTSEGEQQAWIDAFRAQDLDIGVDGPFRVGLVTVDDTRWCLVLVVNHVAIDAFGLDLLAAEMRRRIAGRASEADIGEAWSPVRQAEAEAASGPGEALEYWRRLYEGTPGTLLPRETSTARAIGSVCTRLTMWSPVPADAVAGAARALRTSPANLWLTAYLIVLAAASGNPRCAVIVAASNRARRELASAIGCVFQPAILSADVRRALLIRDLVRTVTRSSLDAQRHARYPFFARKEIEATVGMRRGMRLRLSVDFNFDRADGLVATGDERLADDPPRSITAEEEVREDDLTDVYLWIKSSRTNALLDLVVNRAVADVEGASQLLLQIGAVMSSMAQGASGSPTVGDILDEVSLPVREAGPDWRLVDHTWVNLKQVTDALRSHPGVAAAEVSCVSSAEHGESVLLASVTVVDAALTESDLRRHLLDESLDRPGLAAPHRWRLSAAADPGTGPARDDDGSGELRALKAAIRHVHATAQPTGGESYLAGGGRAETATAILTQLRTHGYAGLSPHDLMTPLSLGALARRLHRLPGA